MDKVMNEIKAELRECEAYCESQGWPGHGSNYELMASDTLRWYEEQYPEYAREIASIWV